MQEIIYDLKQDLSDQWTRLSNQEKAVLFTYMAKITKDIKIDMALLNQVNNILEKHDITVACVQGL